MHKVAPLKELLSIVAFHCVGVAHLITFFAPMVSTFSVVSKRSMMTRR